jgi:hypothetical protein
MPPKKSLDAALTGILASVVKDVVKENVAPLAKEVRQLRRRVESLRAMGQRRAAGGRRRKGGGGRKPRFHACQITGCGQPHLARGFCQTHYNRFKYQKVLDKLAAQVDAGQKVREPGAKTPARRRARRRKGAARKKAGGRR